MTADVSLPVELADPLASHFTDEQLINYAQNNRKALVGKLTARGIPTDPDEQRLMLDALSNIASTAIQNKKINTDSAEQQADRLAALAIARMGAQLDGLNIFEGTSEVVREAPQLDRSRLPNKETVPGSMDVGTQDLDFATFMDKMEGTELPVIDTEEHSEGS